MFRFDAAANVFNPYLVLDKQIAATTKDISSVFGEIDSALDKGKRIRNAVQTERLESAMKRAIGTARLAGFQHGAGVSKKPMPVLYGRTISRFANRRAGKVNGWMNKTTRRTLKRVPDSEYVLSEERALAAARYETGRSYFRGMMDAFAGTDYGKRWVTSAAEPCEDCQENEDAGRLPMGDAFPSGDRFPGAHLHCACILTVTRLRRPGISGPRGLVY